MRPSLVTLLAAAAQAAAQEVDLSGLPAVLKESSAKNWPALMAIGQQIFNDPEVGLNETHAHNRIVEYFQGFPGFVVTPHAFGMETAFRVEFENRPANFTGSLPTVGFLAEYDALIIGHACGHNLIATNGISATHFAADALVHYNLAGKIILMGTPDEEVDAGKMKLNNAGAFDDSHIWMMAHPANIAGIQPMKAVTSLVTTYVGKNHSEAVFNAYSALLILQSLGDQLPGESSSVTGVEDVGVYAKNLVAPVIGFGVAGLNLSTVQSTVDGILDSTYPGVAYTAFLDKDGVSLNITGPGGNPSNVTNSPLVLSTKTFEALKDIPGVSFYLPSNTSVTELDIAVDIRTRYTDELPTLQSLVIEALGDLPNQVAHDVVYPALEVNPALGQLFIDIMKTDDYNIQNIDFSDFAPAGTDASWIQDPVVDPTTHELLSEAVAVLHANYAICQPDLEFTCPPNHQPQFKLIANRDFGYNQTEIVARTQAHMAVRMIADPSEMANVTALIAKR